MSNGQDAVMDWLNFNNNLKPLYTKNHSKRLTKMVI